MTLLDLLMAILQIPVAITLILLLRRGAELSWWIAVPLGIVLMVPVALAISFALMAVGKLITKEQSSP